MKNKKNRLSFLIAVIFLAFCPLFFVFQGLDFSDMGYVITSSRDMLQNPENVYGTGFATILAMVLNGFWMKITASWGLLGARLGVLPVYWTIFLFSYLTVRQAKRDLFSVLFLAITFVFSQRTPWICYNNLSSLLAVASIFFLVRACRFESKSSLFIIIAGFLAGANVFIRLPNVIMLSFSLVPVLGYGLVYGRWIDKKTWSLVSIFVSTAIACVGAGFMAMHLTGYLALFLNGLVDLREIAKNSASSHSLYSLISLLIKDHFRVSVMAIFCVFVGGVLSRACSKRVWSSVVLLVFSGLFSFSLGWFLFNNSALMLHPFLGFVYVGLFVRIWRQAKNGEFENLIVTLSALLFFFCVPLGSDNGITNARHGLWLALPLVMQELWLLRSFNLQKDPRASFDGPISDEVRLFRSIVVVALVVLSLGSAYRYSYRDTADRASMRFSVDHPKLKGIFTTEERAQVVQELLDELGKHVSSGDYLLGYHNVSTVYYLTGTLPYLYNAWPFLYQPSALAYYLDKAVSERASLPVAVGSKYSLQNFEWPIEKYINQSDEYQRNREIIASFLVKNHYVKTWENEIFEIFLPPLKVQLDSKY